MFSSRSFIVSGLTFRSLIHFEFIFVCGVRKCSSFILLQVVDQFSQHNLLKRLSFLHCIFLPPLSKISEVAQSCLTLCDPMDCSLPGFSVDGIFQARILEWLPLLSPGDLPNPGIEPGSPALSRRKWHPTPRRQWHPTPVLLPGKSHGGGAW